MRSWLGSSQIIIGLIVPLTGPLKKDPTTSLIGQPRALHVEEADPLEGAQRLQEP
jgi:hypothetical protein